ncbi:DUF2062 domain-containing protein [Granulosicoccus sp.]|nr:DUF2062 domain-containing protein [Granulosicoccus sp.]
MARNWLKKRLPDPETIRKRLHHMLGGCDQDMGGLRCWIRDTFAQPMVWHLNRRSVSGGVAIGLFVSWIPVPLQMLLAAVLAAVMRVHVPVSVVMVWFTNPLTFAPLLYAAWRSGSMILGRPVLAEPLTFSTNSILVSAGHAWPMLLTGMLFCASISAILGFCITMLAWRINAIRRWKSRAIRRAAARDASGNVT